MRTITPPRTLVLCTLVVLAVTTGCSDKGAGAQSSASRSDHNETQAAGQETAAVQEAEQAVRDYFLVRDQCLADPPNTDPSCFDAVAVDQQLLNDRAALEYSMDRGSHHVGEVKVVETERVVEVQLSPGTKEITLSICLDGTDLDIVGSDGTSVKPEGNSRGRLLFFVRKHVDTWQVADTADDPEGGAC